MANAEHVAILKKGIAEWHSWNQQRTPRERIDLSGADFAGTNLAGIVLAGANLWDTNFRGANLSNAFITFAHLMGADLAGADLRNTLLSGSNLRIARLGWANLSGADLSGVELNSANLIGASFSHATMAWTALGDVNLSVANGLAQVKHNGPSHVGIDTIYKSEGKIPEAFLRGAGVPEQFIRYALSFVGQAAEFHSCFISYSSQDQEFTARLHADLRSKNLRCWYAPEDLKIGDRFQERIEESIRLYDKVMIVLSEASVQSRWVEREVNAAREREHRENRVVLYPIRIDDAVMDAPEPWAADIRRSRHIGDFRRWKEHDSYQKGLERLLRDLRADAAPPPRL
jgi:TIR domain/Pentapeptide repeats (8 copies)